MASKGCRTAPLPYLQLDILESRTLLSVAIASRTPTDGIHSAATRLQRHARSLPTANATLNPSRITARPVLVVNSAKSLQLDENGNPPAKASNPQFNSGDPLPSIVLTPLPTSSSAQDSPDPLPSIRLNLIHLHNDPLPALVLTQLPASASTKDSTDPLPAVRLIQLHSPITYDWHTQTVDGVLNVWAPNPSDFGITFTVDDAAGLFGPDGVPNIEGVHQGPVADCYLLAAEAAFALDHPEDLMSIVQNDPNGGWIVTFQYYDPAAGHYSPIKIHTNNQLSLTYQGISNDEAWSYVIEKAYAAFRTWNGVDSVNTLDSTWWGFPAVALANLGELSNQVFYSSMSDQTFCDLISSSLAAKQPVLVQTLSNAPTMIESHVYTVTGVYTDADGVRWIKMYNPWGFYDTRTVDEVRQNGIGTMVIGD